MSLRSTLRNLIDYRLLLAKLNKDRREFNPLYFAQLRRILRRRIGALRSKLRTDTDQPHNGRAT